VNDKFFQGNREPHSFRSVSLACRFPEEWLGANIIADALAIGAARKLIRTQTLFLILLAWMP
jgi:hypothetical protein